MAERQHAECAYNVGAFPGRVLSYVHAAAGRRARCRRAHVRNACTAARTTNNKAGSGRLALQAAVHGVVRQACSEAAWAATWQTAALCKAVQGPRGRPSPGARGARLADGGERGADVLGPLALRLPGQLQREHGRQPAAAEVQEVLHGGRPVAASRVRVARLPVLLLQAAQQLAQRRRVALGHHRLRGARAGMGQGQGHGRATPWPDGVVRERCGTAPLRRRHVCCLKLNCRHCWQDATLPREGATTMYTANGSELAHAAG